jgi:diaminohydroxyphosphoribosylaminopyrimidine deaminase/5-amino-6-(5-phosphoribosylamino)uracil reductase
MTQQQLDEQFMDRALMLAAKGAGHVSPNPMVGAVIVKDGRIIGEGYHEKYGQLHAERNALAACTEDPHGATMYVTLEPCCHYGKTPPCTEAILERGIARVVIGAVDPNPLVGGEGIHILKEHGIEVTEGVRQEECLKINEVFFHYIQTKQPFVILKYAMTLDGKIATVSGQSKWISGEASRENTHKDRNRYRAIMVGVQTAIEDDPLLNCRIEGGVDPIRIVCDTHLRTPLGGQLVQTANEIPLILATCETDAAKKEAYESRGAKVLTVSEKDGHVDLKELFCRLGSEEQIDSILLEGGGTLNGTALKEGLVDKVQAYIAPKLFGGQNAKNPVGGEGIAEIADAVRLEEVTVRQLGEDILVEGKVVKQCLPES